METPLITEERINPVLEGGSKGKQYHRRSDAIAFGDRYQKAAALVDLVSSLYLRVCLCVCCVSLDCACARVRVLLGALAKATSHKQILDQSSCFNL